MPLSSSQGNISRSATGSPPLEQEQGRRVLALLQKFLIPVAITVWDGSNRQRRLDLNLWCTTNKCVSMAHISMVSLSSWLNKRSCVFFYSYLAHPLHHRKPKLWVAPADESKNRNVKHIPIRFPASNDPTPRKISVVKCIHVCVKRNHTPNPNKSQYQQPKSQWKTAQHNTASIMWPDLVQ